MIIYGHRHYGCTDEIEGLGHVQTRFVHIWFLPLIPFSSTFVVGEDGDGVRGVKVPLSFKSVFSVWTRTAALLGGIGALVGGIALTFASAENTVRALQTIQTKRITVEKGVSLATEMGMGLGGLCMAAVCVAVYFLVGRVFRKAGEERKAEILALLGFEPDPVSSGGIEDPDASPGFDAEPV